MSERQETCKNCKKTYDKYAFYNYNLGLCQECLDEAEKTGEACRDEWCDTVIHVTICPVCGRRYVNTIQADEKCETEGCPVYFFWDDLDCAVFAKWLKSEEDEYNKMKKEEKKHEYKDEVDEPSPIV